MNETVQELEVHQAKFRAATGNIVASVSVKHPFREEGVHLTGYFIGEEEGVNKMGIGITRPLNDEQREQFLQEAIYGIEAIVDHMRVPYGSEILHLSAQVTAPMDPEEMHEQAVEEARAYPFGTEPDTITYRLTGPEGTVELTLQNPQGAFDKDVLKYIAQGFADEMGITAWGTTAAVWYAPVEDEELDEDVIQGPVRDRPDKKEAILVQTAIREDDEMRTYLRTHGKGEESYTLELDEQQGAMMLQFKEESD